jgi:hypothetical protein
MDALKAKGGRLEAGSVRKIAKLIGAGKSAMHTALRLLLGRNNFGSYPGYQTRAGRVDPMSAPDRQKASIAFPQRHARDHLISYDCPSLARGCSEAAGVVQRR